MSPLPKKRHRPASLDLETPSQNDVAVRIVSPGLPPLNEKMKTTVKISQKIEQQQRHLIAARNQSNPNSSNNLSFLNALGALGLGTLGVSSVASSANSSAIGIPIHVTTATTSTSEQSYDLTDGMDKLVTPTTAKRLKRENIPSPLHISSTQSNSPQYRPSIQSAPIRSFKLQYPQAPLRPMVGHRRLQHGVVAPQYQQQPQPPHGVQMGPVGAPKRLRAPGYTVGQSGFHAGQPIGQPIGPPVGQPIPAYIHSPYRKMRVVTPAGQYFSGVPRGPGTAAAAAAAATTPAVRAYPISTALGQPQQYFIPYSYHHQNQNQQPQPQPQYVLPQNSSTPIHRSSKRSVTDVYHGDFTRAAPPQAQPLSAQYEYFGGSSGNRSDRLPVTDEEIIEMQNKYKDEGGDEDPEDAAIDDDDEKHSRMTWKSTEYGQIFGSINLMNESVFNFKIFKSAPNLEPTKTEDSKIEKKGEEKEYEVEKEHEQEQETVTTKKNEETVSTEEPTVDSSKSAREVSPSPKDTWLSQEKAKFMKICETSWDEFISTRM